MLLHPSSEDISVGYVFPHLLVDLPGDSHARNMELKPKFRHHIKNCLFMIICSTDHKCNPMPFTHERYMSMSCSYLMLIGNGIKLTLF